MAKKKNVWIPQRKQRIAKEGAKASVVFSQIAASLSLATRKLLTLVGLAKPIVGTPKPTGPAPTGTLAALANQLQLLLNAALQPMTTGASGAPPVAPANTTTTLVGLQAALAAVLNSLQNVGNTPPPIPNVSSLTASQHTGGTNNVPPLTTSQSMGGMGIGNVSSSTPPIPNVPPPPSPASLRMGSMSSTGGATIIIPTAGLGTTPTPPHKYGAWEGAAAIYKAPIAKIVQLLEMINQATKDTDRFIEKSEKEGGVGGSLKGALGGFIQASRMLMSAGGRLSGEDHTVSGIAYTAAELTASTGVFMGAAGAVAAVIPGGQAVALTLEGFALGLELAAGSLAIFGNVAKMVEAFGNNLLQANFRFAEWSASMQGIKVLQEMREISLTNMRGERLAPSAGKAADMKFELDKKLFAPLEDAFTEFKNELFVSIGGVALTIVDWLKEKFPELAQLFKKYEDANATLYYPNELKNIAEKYMADHGRPPHLP